ncbi:MAG: hypothetical protein KCHDKBKB_01135 [Elusimicrobia bacterium]|nr:hypothetical protein [Elusimicrobiota bacterium]
MNIAHRDQLENILERVLAIARQENKLSGFCIGNTTKVDSHGFFFTPIRNTTKLVAGSVIVYEAHHAEAIARLVDGRVNYLLVDTEKKVRPDVSVYGIDDKGNIERAVRDAAKRSRVLTYKGNDLTVESIDALLNQSIQDPIRGMGGKKVVILGAGNLGFKLALKEVERGAQVVITRRDKKKLETLVQTLNIVKPPFTVAQVTGLTDNEKAAIEADVLIGMTEGLPVITKTMVQHLHDKALILDAGKGCISPEAITVARERNFRILRVDIRAGFEGMVATLLEMERLLNHTVGRREWQGVPLVSGGLLGWEGEVVVDNVHNPQVIFGIANGLGDFVRRLTPDQEVKLRTLQQAIDEKKQEAPLPS